MRIKVLSSGSKGNTTYIECKNTKIIIDMGNSCKYVNEKLKGIGIDGNDIDAILITHTHVDHIKGLKVFCKKFNTFVYGMKGFREDLDYISNYIEIDSDSFKIGDINISVIKTSHDAIDSIGYVIEEDDSSLVYVTDTGYINRKYFDLLSNRDMYIMESNHDVEMLNNSRYPFNVRQRILGDKGHLSNIDSSRYLANFVGDRTKCIVLAHLSEENNTPSLAYNTLIESFDEANKDICDIIVAKQDEETEFICL